MMISSAGGHLSELLALESFFQEYDYSIITEYNISSAKGLSSKYSKVGYFIPGTKNQKILYPFKFILNMFIALFYMLKYRPDAIVSTGTHSTVFMCYLGWLLRKKVIWIETFANSQTKTLSGRMVYPIATHFLVQWESMLELYPKAVYKGSVF